MADCEEATLSTSRSTARRGCRRAREQLRARAASATSSARCAEVSAATTMQTIATATIDADRDHDAQARAVPTGRLAVLSERAVARLPASLRPLKRPPVGLFAAHAIGQNSLQLACVRRWSPLRRAGAAFRAMALTDGKDAPNSGTGFRATQRASIGRAGDGDMGGAQRRRPALAQIVEIGLARLDPVDQLGVAGVAPHHQRGRSACRRRGWSAWSNPSRSAPILSAS